MEKRRHFGLVYFFAFTFLMLCLFGGVGAYNNHVTGQATIDLSDSLENSFGLIFEVFRGILKPLIGFLGETEEGYLGMKLLMGIFLFFILYFSLRKTGESDKGFLKDLAIPGSIIISLAFVVLVPDTLMRSVFGAPGSAGPFVSFILVLLGIVGTFFIFKYMHQWQAENGFEEVAKAIVYFFIFVIVSLGVTLIQTSVNGVLPITLLGLLASITTIYCLISIIIHFTKAFTIGHLATSKFGLEKSKNFGELSKERKEYFGKELNQEMDKIKSDLGAFIGKEIEIINNLTDTSHDYQFLSDLRRTVDMENSLLNSVGLHGFFTDMAIPRRNKALIQSYIRDIKSMNEEIKKICKIKGVVSWRKTNLVAIANRKKEVVDHFKRDVRSV